MPVRTVRPENIILTLKSRANSGSYRFLTGAQMDGTTDLAAKNRIDQAFLARPDAHHRTV
jgi:hypothetical protein